ncbi:unnamed protein product, partial [Prorocentrum cordatum]
TGSKLSKEQWQEQAGHALGPALGVLAPARWPAAGSLSSARPLPRPERRRVCWGPGPGRQRMSRWRLAGCPSGLTNLPRASRSPVAAPERKADLDHGALAEAGGRGADKAAQLPVLQALGEVGGPRALEREPQKWPAYVDAAAFAQLGCDATRMPWSMALYGRQMTRFGRLEERERFWEMLASLRALRGPQRFDLFGARIGQFMAATQQSVNSHGSWRLVWLITGFPDPRSRSGRPPGGPARAAGVAASVAYLRETALDGALRRRGGDAANDRGSKGVNATPDRGGVAGIHGAVTAAPVCVRVIHWVAVAALLRLAQPGGLPLRAGLPVRAGLFCVEKKGVCGLGVIIDGWRRNSHEKSPREVFLQYALAAEIPGGRRACLERLATALYASQFAELFLQRGGCFSISAGDAEDFFYLLQRPGARVQDAALGFDPGSSELLERRVFYGVGVYPGDRAVIGLGDGLASGPIRACVESAGHAIGGFVPSRNFGNNIVELDGASREYSQQDNVSVAMPLLVSFDFQQAFPSVAHQWLFLVLRRAGLPEALCWFFAELYRCVQCWSANACSSSINNSVYGNAALLYYIQSGIVQGCPGSGFLFAVAADPFMLDFDWSINRRALGLVRACADDVGAAIRTIRALKIFFRIFRAAARVAALVLKPSKCKIVPLCGPFSEETHDQYAQWIADHLPTWSSFKIVPELLHLGLYLGPAVHLQSWHAPIQKWRERGLILAQQQGPHRVTAQLYSSRVTSVLTYVAQFMPLPAEILSSEAALLARLWRSPHCVISRAGFFNLWRWGGPKFPSALILSSATLLRSSATTLQSWPSVLASLRETADRCLPLPIRAAGSLSPSFWRQPSFAEFLSSAAACYPANIGQDLVTSSSPARELLAAAATSAVTSLPPPPPNR